MDNTLNLARKWRSRTFDEIAGQELPVRMLKNSLYRDHYFPVYLFSGQRGCGKTTAARIFAAAVNCALLNAFQHNPQEKIPCLSCKSCLAMYQGNHPDFIEIDAASHTGVDNVRQIIDAAAFMPLLGRKKIYLIDEAHMLSKAAFNAFLKILEEPPASVFFILATTDPQKIIETVTSRCFQILFKPLPVDTLVNHVQFICQQEGITCEKEGLRIIAHRSEGSVRDAINLMEQVRFSSDQVDKKAVLETLGHVDEDHSIKILSFLVHKKPADLLLFLQSMHIESFDASIVWHALVELIRAGLVYKYGVAANSPDALKRWADACSPALLTSFLELFYRYESIFLKTRAQYRVLEYVLLQCMQLSAPKNKNEEGVAIIDSAREEQKALSSSALNVQGEAELKPAKEPENLLSKSASAAENQWSEFLHSIATLDDPLVSSVFKQGNFVRYEQSIHKVILSFPKNCIFFGDLLESTQPVWQKILKKTFGENAMLDVIFDGQTRESTALPFEAEARQKPAQSQQLQPLKRAAAAPEASLQKKFISSKKIQGSHNANEHKVDISDKTKWKKAYSILSVFPGTVTEIKDEHA
jgi:DNA polymerase-3 subunit gamma/tau